MIKDEEGNTFEFSYTDNSIYDDHSWFVVSWWGRYSYFNNENFQISDIEIMNALFGSSGYFG